MRRKPDTSGIKVDPNEIDYDSMLFYITWYEQILKLEKTMGSETAWKAFRQLCEYSFHGEMPDNSDNPVLAMFFEMAKGSIDSNIRYRIRGKMAAEKRWGKNTEEEPEQKKTRTRKKKDEPTPEPITEEQEPEEDDDEGWLEPTDENIAKMKAMK